MKKVLIGAALATVLLLASSSLVLAAGPGGAPHVIEVNPDGSPVVSFDQGPGDDQLPPHIVIDTPQGTVEPTL